MQRFLIAGLCGLAALVLPASAAPPPQPPQLADGTPETIDGYATFDIYRNFTDWTGREASKALKTRADLNDTLTELNGGIRVLSFRVKGDWPYSGSAGGIEEICNKPEGGVFTNGRATLTEEEIEEFCYWQLRIVDLDEAREVAQSWMGPAFDARGAAAYLAAQGVPPGKGLISKKIDWSGFRDPAPLHTAPALRYRVWTSRTCDMFPTAFHALQSIPLNGFQVEGFNKRAKVEYAMPHSPWLDVTVHSVNGGARGELRFAGYAGMPATVLDVVDNLIDTCKPEAPAQP